MAEISEDRHRAAEARVKLYSYEAPGDGARNKTNILLGKSELIRGMVQVVKEGGENNLHYHSNVDALWMVLGGKAKFYGPGDVLIGEIGKHEGITIPRYARYWFESSGEAPLEILLVQAFAEPQPVEQATAMDSGRTDAAPRKQPLAQGMLTAER